ncbi:MAG: PRC-barrel domain containing protein [Desulfobacteraceae bacterium]|nr:PRC-barrel domain containing protein [Desulfobacteraceae bacterium]
MDYPLNADVHCTDGRYGRSTYIILNPTAEKVTHVVVKDRKAPQSERLLPARWIKETTSELILVNGTKEEVRTLNLFDQTDFVQRDVPHYATDPKLTLLWPRTVPARRIVSDRHLHIPDSDLAVCMGTQVRATDGRVGEVNEFVVNPENWQITHMVLREGLLWDKKQISIPVSEIERIEEKTVFLKINKQAVKNLPSISLRR